MRLTLLSFITAATCWFFGAEARAADLAVMPVEGVGLSPGDAEALGVLFSRAVSRDAHVVVASPQITKPLLDGGQTAAAVAGRLGASGYVQLAATRLGAAIKLSGSLFGTDGSLQYRTETSGPGLDEMEFAIAALAHSLIWRTPVAAAPPSTVATAGSASQEAPGPPPDADASRGSYGPKLGLVMPVKSGTTFVPGIAIQFDARYGPPSYFLELGAGLVIPYDEYAASSTVRVGMGYLELGASHYLWTGDAALYVGGGLSPALWTASSGYDSHVAATGSAYAQLGLAFNRRGRAKFYGELRLSQMLIAVAHPIENGSTAGTRLSDPYRPLLLAVQGGVGW